MIEREDVGGVAVLRMAHGPVNAMDVELCHELTAALGEAAGARAVVVTGSGRTFSAGVDLRRLVAGGPGYVTDFLPALGELFRVAFTLPVPMVAAVNGHAIAGGCVLAAAADVALMVDGPGRIGVPEIKVGVPFPQIALEVLRHRVGDVVTRRLVVEAGTSGAAAALAVGLVDELVDLDALPDRAVEVADGLATTVPADTFALTKAQLRREGTERAALADDTGVLDLWRRRAADGWTARYLEQVTRR